MKTASNDLVTLLNTSTQFVMCDLFTITTRFNEVLRYTSADCDVISGGNTFSSKGPLIKRGMTKVVLGLQVDSLDMAIYADSTHLLNGAPFIASAMSGALDGASIKLERAFLNAWDWPASTAVGSIIQFVGRVSDVDGTRTSLKITVKSDLELLNVKMPRVVFEPSCSRTLYDSGCGASRAAATITGRQIHGASTKTVLSLNLPEGASNTFDLGVIEFTSGANAGIARTVRTSSENAVRVAFPFPNTPAIGDTFKITKGCRKTMADCQNKHNNIIRFRGFPFVPAPETIT